MKSIESNSTKHEEKRRVSEVCIEGHGDPDERIASGLFASRSKGQTVDLNLALIPSTFAQTPFVLSSVSSASEWLQAEERDTLTDLDDEASEENVGDGVGQKNRDEERATKTWGPVRGGIRAGSRAERGIHELTARGRNQTKSGKEVVSSRKEGEGGGRDSSSSSPLFSFARPLKRLLGQGLDDWDTERGEEEEGIKNS